MAEPVSMNTDEVIAAILGRSPGGKKRVGLSVGFSAPYAVYVHEDMTASHPNGGQAKYLEAAYRDPSVIQRMRDSIRNDLKNKKGIYDAVVNAANILLRAAMDLVPVDTGFLRDSGFVGVTEN